jgi:hypothetical protein
MSGVVAGVVAMVPEGLLLTSLVAIVKPALARHASSELPAVAPMPTWCVRQDGHLTEERSKA